MNLDEIERSVIKSGEQVVMFRLRKTKQGLCVITKIHPEIEEMVRGWGTGEIQPAVAHGRNWHTLTKEQDPLHVWQLSRQTGIYPVDANNFYRIDRPGMELLLDDGQTMNLSMVRLVGASEGFGVPVAFRSVHTPEGITQLAERLKQAAKRFYIDFMRPVDITVIVSTQEMRP